MKERTNTIKACAYSLGIHEDVLAEMLPLLKAADGVRKEVIKLDDRPTSIHPISIDFAINGSVHRMKPDRSI